MLAEKQDSNEREFYSLSKRKVCARLPFPDAKNEKCVDVGFGWMLTVSASGANRNGDLGEISDGKVCLVKPFYSSPKIELPNLKKFPEYYKYEGFPDFAFFLTAVLLANPSETSDFTLVLVTEEFIVFRRNGDENWPVINQDAPIRGIFTSMVYYKGCIYARNHCRIWMWDPNGIDLTKAQITMELKDTGKTLDDEMAYLVESTNGELLVILRNNHLVVDEYVGLGANDFRVMRVDLEKGTIIEAETNAIFVGTMKVDLEKGTIIEVEKRSHVNNDAIFVGNNASVAVATADYPGVLKPNCIYFTNNCINAYFDEPVKCKEGWGRDMGIYNDEDGSIEKFNVQSFSHISPPIWVFPSF